MNEEKEFEKNSAPETSAKLMKGATVLVVAGIVGKIFGAVFRIPLTNLIGAEGQSYYGVSYSVYQNVLILATAGFPVAISKMVSERIAVGDYRNAHRTYRVSMQLMMIIGIISFIFCSFFAGSIATFMGNPDARFSIMALSPALLLAPIVASFRGYFQGQQNMFPTGISEVFEQMFRVIIGLSLSFFLIRYGKEYASAGATFGASAGLFFALIVLTVIYKKSERKRMENIINSESKLESRKSLMKELVSIAIPITIGSIIMPLSFFLDSVIVMRRLQATGWSYTMSKTLFGLISGYCDSLTALPGTFIDALAIALMPAVATALTLKNIDVLNKNVKTGIKTMMVIAFPCAIGLIVLARPILHLLYPFRLEEADMAVSILQIQSISIITLSSMRIFSSVLQGIGKVNLPVRNLFIGILVKVAATYILVGIRDINVNGASMGSVLAFLVASLLNHYDMKKYADIEVDMKEVFIKPFVASALMGGVAFVSYKLLFAITDINSVSTLVAIIAAVAAYFLLVFQTKIIGREEAKLIPKGDILIKFAEKLHLIK